MLDARYFYYGVSGPDLVSLGQR